MIRIFVRNRRDRSRFIGRRGWIVSRRRARNFPSTHAAIVFCHEHEIADAEVLVRFGEPGTADVAINLPTELSTGCAVGEEWLELADQLAPMTNS
ncbi:MAG TPA: hypothetical protein VK530_02095 [Candidatus Acidoferrum sp.]|nr:hypothetical protein [Candidatus Acidoferrum sp.]